MRRSAFLDTRVIYFLMLVCLCGCRFFPESQFELAPDSPLPKWFTLPKYLSRADVTVQMSYYIGPCGTLGYDNGLGCATFELWDIRKYTHGKKQAVITEPDGVQYFGLLDMHGQKTMSWEMMWPNRIVAVDGNIIQQENVQSNPSYVVVNAWGITEVIEHKHPGDVFYIDDDAAVRGKLGLAGSSNKSDVKN